MYEVDDIEDVDELLYIARSLSDRLAVVAESHRLKYIAIGLGFYIALCAILVTGFVSLKEFIPNIRFGQQFYDIAPLLLIFSLYIFSALCSAYYRLQLDRVGLRLARKRLDAAIAEAEVADVEVTISTKSDGWSVK